MTLASSEHAAPAHFAAGPACRGLSLINTTAFSSAVENARVGPYLPSLFRQVSILRLGSGRDDRRARKEQQAQQRRGTAECHAAIPLEPA